MKASSLPSTSSVDSTSAGLETRLLSSSSPSPAPCLSLQSPELQAEFLQECRNKFQSHSNVSESSVVSPATDPSSPRTPSSSSPSPGPGSRQARLSLSSPELLSELKASRTRPLRRVPAHSGLTTVFSGRGGRASAPVLSTRAANQMTSH